MKQNVKIDTEDNEMEIHTTHKKNLCRGEELCLSLRVFLDSKNLKWTKQALIVNVVELKWLPKEVTQVIYSTTSTESTYEEQATLVKRLKSSQASLEDSFVRGTACDRKNV